MSRGTTIRVADAVNALVTLSANDAAVVIAEAIGGSEDEFARLMTRKAHALGMSRTTYVNASGLPDDDQVTSARDQALLGRLIAELDRSLSPRQRAHVVRRLSDYAEDFAALAGEKKGAA